MGTVDWGEVGTLLAKGALWTAFLVAVVPYLLSLYVRTATVAVLRGRRFYQMIRRHERELNSDQTRKTKDQR